MDLEPKLAHVLAADVGNTHVTLGVVHGDQVYAVQKLAADELDRLPAILDAMWQAMDKPRRVVACSVNDPLLERFKLASIETLEEPVAVVGEDIPLPLPTSLSEPEAIGVDRLCCAAAAFGRLQQACVVVDVGTAITIDCVSEDGEFLGGAILPGMRMQARALHSGTAQLPEVELTSPTWVFGRNTQEAILSGIVNGVRGAVRERVEAYATELRKWPLVICTGGDAELLGDDEGRVQATVEGLCLLGVARAFYQSLVKDDG